MLKLINFHGTLAVWTKFAVSHFKTDSLKVILEIPEAVGMGVIMRVLEGEKGN